MRQNLNKKAVLLQRWPRDMCWGSPYSTVQRVCKYYRAVVVGRLRSCY